MKTMLLGFLGNLQYPELLILLFIILVLFGAKKIPDLARGLGLGVKEFKKGLHEDPAAPPAAPVPPPAGEVQKTAAAADPRIEPKA